jgi:peptidoglycan/LPS O-acetylase OafA/YrhL
VTAESATGQSLTRVRLRRYFPLDNGPNEIRALDGLRATAALSVLIFHVFYLRGLVVGNPQTAVLGYDVTFVWTYLASGVELFFVLSGFLLFLPYARAILDARPLPSMRNFYRRRALRILPAYWVCLALLVLSQLPTYFSKAGVKDILVHIVLIHNLYPIFNSAIEGPFWTLAVEAQFYLILPLLAWCIAGVIGKTRSVGRSVLSILGVIVIALALRESVAFLNSHAQHMHGWQASAVDGLLVFVTSTQGRYLEVFALGMLCSVIYVAILQRGLHTSIAVRRAGWALVGGSLVVSYLLAHRVLARIDAMLGLNYQFMRPTDFEAICGPFLVGLGYALLVLGILLGASTLKALLASAPLRFVGLISYSLYLWHLPLLLGALTDTPSTWSATTRADVGLAIGSLVALSFAYVSYALVERPFLQRRHRVTSASTQDLVVSPARS